MRRRTLLLALFAPAAMSAGCTGADESSDTTMSLSERKAYCLILGNGTNNGSDVFSDQYFADAYHSDGCGAICGPLSAFPGWMEDDLTKCPNDES